MSFQDFVGFLKPSVLNEVFAFWKNEELRLKVRERCVDHCVEMWFEIAGGKLKRPHVQRVSIAESSEGARILETSACVSICPVVCRSTALARAIRCSTGRECSQSETRSLTTSLAR